MRNLSLKLTHCKAIMVLTLMVIAGGKLRAQPPADCPLPEGSRLNIGRESPHPESKGTGGGLLKWGYCQKPSLATLPLEYPCRDSLYRVVCDSLRLGIRLAVRPATSKLSIFYLISYSKPNPLMQPGALKVAD